MQKTQLSITLQNQIAYDRALNHWMIQEVGPAYDALKAKLKQALTLKQVREALAAEQKKTKKHNPVRSSIAG
jgi:hypothetical protein